jgi:hypothetical protein
VLLIIKVVAVVLSGSISLISSLVDSSVDLLSGVVIWVTTRAVKKTDRYSYPQGEIFSKICILLINGFTLKVLDFHVRMLTLRYDTLITLAKATGGSIAAAVEYSSQKRRIKNGRLLLSVSL